MTLRVKIMSLSVAAVLCVPLVVSVTAEAADDVLLSRGRPVSASSAASIPNAAAYAVDGDLTTSWWSAASPATQWLQVDLGAARSVDRVTLHWDHPYATAYRVQTSTDGVSWTDIARVRDGHGRADDLRKLSGAGRYLRVLLTRHATGSAAYGIAELNVYGPGPAAPAQQPSTPNTLPSAPAPTGLADPKTKEIALELISSAENSTLDWRSEYGYLEDLGDGRGYTGGIIGFCSGTSDMLALVTAYTRREPHNPLAAYLPALRTVDGSDSHRGLDPGFPAAWRLAARDPVFQQAQQHERDNAYVTPAVALARADGLRALGQYAYVDAAVMHGMSGLHAIRAQTLQLATVPSAGGDEIAWLNAFLDARVREMRTEAAHRDTSRVDTAQRVFLTAGNLDLRTPLTWSVYGDRYSIN